jgi:orotidine-5'-phosphate decarboxylase
MSGQFTDRLLDAIRHKGSPVCVGLDPLSENLPESVLRKAGGDPVRAIGIFCREVLEIVAPVVPAVKPQIAHFERHRHAGVKLYFDLVKRARRLGLIVIGDVKRCDIGSTAECYAAGQLAGSDAPDAVTVNGYLGADGLAPFVDVCRREGKGIFVLVRTSNPSAAAIQDFADASGKKFYEHMGQQVAAIGSSGGLIGAGGYSCVGAVVGATYPQEARRLREIMPQQIFLVPGYGAQGATAADCAAAFKPDGTGAIVNASRSVIYAFRDKKYAGVDWKEAVESAAKAFAEDIRNAVAGREP